MARKPVIQKHHISYNPDVWVWVFKGEHMLLDGRMGLNRRQNISRGFIIALDTWLAQHRHLAKPLEENQK